MAGFQTSTEVSRPQRSSSCVTSCASEAYRPASCRNAEHRARSGPARAWSAAVGSAARPRAGGLARSNRAPRVARSSWARASKGSPAVGTPKRAASIVCAATWTFAASGSGSAWFAADSAPPFEVATTINKNAAATTAARDPNACRAFGRVADGWLISSGDLGSLESLVHRVHKDAPECCTFRRFYAQRDTRVHKNADSRDQVARQLPRVFRSVAVLVWVPPPARRSRA